MAGAQATLKIVLGTSPPFNKTVQVTDTVESFKQWLADAFRISADRLTLTLTDLQAGINQATNMDHANYSFSNYGIGPGHEPTIKVTAQMEPKRIRVNLILNGPDFEDVWRTHRTFEWKTVNELKEEIKGSCCHDLVLGVNPYVAVEPTDGSGLHGVQLMNGDEMIISYLVTGGSTLCVDQDEITSDENEEEDDGDGDKCRRRKRIRLNLSSTNNQGNGSMNGGGGDMW